MKSILLLSALGVSAVMAEEPQVLAYKPEVGKTYLTSVDTKMEMEMKNPMTQEAMEINSDTLMEMSLAVEKDPKGVKMLTTVNRFKMKTLTPGVPMMEYDSADESASDSPLAPMMKEIVGFESGVVFNDEGEFVESIGLEDDSALQQLGMTGDQFSETLKESFAMYPKKEVVVGDSWTVGQEMSLGALSPEPLIANTTYTLSGYEELDASKVAKITFTGEIDGSMNMGGAKMTVKTEKFEGVVYHDLKLNVPRLSISEISMTIAVPEGAEGKGIGSIPMDIKVTQKLIEVK